jgi:hypothetical protein
MKKRYRVKECCGRFYPQEKFLWWWHYFYKKIFLDIPLTYGVGMPYENVQYVKVRFDNIEEAWNYIKNNKDCNIKYHYE